MSDLTKTSKFLSLILRHEPERIGLSLNSEGWAKVEELIKCSNEAGFKLTGDMLNKVVETNEKKRFRFSDDGLYIRANQGHSVKINLGLSPIEPPEFLYHGTATRFLSSIRQKGLLKGERHHVHLSPDVDTARNVGIRHGKPIILTINSHRMFKDGYKFYCSENGVWLTAHVPAIYISELK